jgi:hypothetical protein
MNAATEGEAVETFGHYPEDEGSAETALLEIGETEGIDLI